MSQTDSQFSIRVLTSVDEIVLPQVLNLYDYWCGKRGSQCAPRPNQIDLLDLHENIADVIVVDVLEDGDEFSVRFIGQENVIRIGKDISEIVNEPAEMRELKNRSNEVFKLVVSSGLPVLDGPRSSAISGKEFLTLQSISLPLIRDGDVKQILIIVGNKSLSL